MSVSVSSISYRCSAHVEARVNDETEYLLGLGQIFDINDQGWKLYFHVNTETRQIIPHLTSLHLLRGDRLPLVSLRTKSGGRRPFFVQRNKRNIEEFQKHALIAENIWSSLHEYPRYWKLDIQITFSPTSVLTSTA